MFVELRVVLLGSRGVFGAGGCLGAVRILGVFCVWEVLECGGCLGLGALLPPPPPAPPFGRGPPSLRCRGDPKAAAPLYFSPLPPPFQPSVGGSGL